MFWFALKEMVKIGCEYKLTIEQWKNSGKTLSNPGDEHAILLWSCMPSISKIICAKQSFFIFLNYYNSKCPHNWNSKKAFFSSINFSSIKHFNLNLVCFIFDRNYTFWWFVFTWRQQNTGKHSSLTTSWQIKIQNQAHLAQYRFVLFIYLLLNSSALFVVRLLPKRNCFKWNKSIWLQK